MSAFFSGTETAFFSLNRIQRRRLESDPRGRRVLRMLEHPDLLLSTILLGNTVVNVVASALAAMLVADYLGGSLGMGVSVLGMTFLLLVAGEISPKTLAVHHAEAWTRRAAPPVATLISVSRPVTRLLSHLGSYPLRHVSTRSAADDSLDRSEMVSLVELGRLEGVLGEEARPTLALMNLDHISCKHAMIPRNDAVTVRTDWPASRVEAAVRETSHTRYPVVDGPEEKVVGYVMARDVLAPGRRTVAVHAIPAFPETVSARRVLKGLRRTGAEIGAVFDEYGDWSGIVTVDDVLEIALFQGVAEEGELPPGVVRRAGRLDVPGSLGVEALSRLTGVDLQAQYATTCAGLLEEVSGRIPAVGERIATQGLVFQIREADGRRVLRVRVTPGGE
jgi:CBS domain containing-hemolysin-like protein